MVRKNIVPVCVFTTIAALYGLSEPNPGVAADLSPMLNNTALNELRPSTAVPGSTSSAHQTDRVAQFFPYANSDEQVVMVNGQGRASASADSAEIEFVFLNYDPYAYYDPYLCSYESETSLDRATSPAETPNALPSEECPPLAESAPITRTVLQPAIVALTEAGISANEINIRLPEDTADPNDYASYYYPDSASVSLSLAQPTPQRVQELVEAVEDAVIDNDALYLTEKYVEYTLNQEGCQALERDAYINAVANARDRATVLAEALNVEIGDVPSVADSIFEALGFTPYSSYCDNRSDTSLLSYPSPSYYEPTAPAEVQLQRNVFVTFPIRGR